MAEARAWETYPSNWPRRDEAPLNLASLRRRLEDPEGIFFSESDDINVRIIDLDEATAISQVYNDADELLAAINGRLQEKTRIRIISVSSKRTIEPLQITSDLMRKILHKYEVHPDFLRVLFSFGEEPHLAEASSGNLAIHSPTPEETYISYQVNYVEENLRRGQDPWSFRHTGVYHHHTSEFDLYILLHPNQHGVLEESLLEMLGIGSHTEPNQTQVSDFCRQPYRLHLLVLSTFFDNWRWYFRYLGDRFARENNQAMVVRPENSDPKSSFRRVQNLRNMNDFALFAKACCACNLEVLEKLMGSTIIPLNDASGLETQATTLRGYVESSRVLEGRIRNAIDLVGYTLTLHNQLETAKIEGELRDMTEQLKNLTQDTVDDSATVTIITYVSAVYLPGSFVATVYGMNFFIFDPVTKKIAIGDNFWVYVVTWLPLTAITAAIYILTLWLTARRKGKPFRWPWTRRKQKLSVENGK